MDQSKADSVPSPAVRRLSLYLRQLELFERRGRRTVSSRQLAESLDLTDTQVRKDLAYFGQFGRPGIGYKVVELIAELRRIFGTDHTWNVLLVGAGNLGRALMAYRGFEQRGFRMVAAFDTDPEKVGKKVGGFMVQPLSELASTVRRLDVRLGILAVPASVAQGLTDRLVSAGIRGILNFAPASLTVPHDVPQTSVDLAVHLEQLSFQVSLSKYRPNAV